VARESLHKSVVIAVLVLGNLALLVLDSAKLREEGLESRIHIDLTLVSLILELVVTNVGSDELESLLAGNKKVIAVIGKVIYNKLTVIVSEGLVVLKEGAHLLGINRLELLETLVAVRGTVLTAALALLIKALNIALKALDVSSNRAGSLDEVLEKGLSRASHLD